VLLSLARLFPDAPIFTAVYAPDARVSEAFGKREIYPSPLQMIPGTRKLYRKMLPLMPWAFRRMDVSGFDLVISSSHAFAKSVRVSPGAIQLCYCHTPPRYLWDLYESYNSGFLGVMRGPIMSRLKLKDAEAARHVHSFVANSSYVADRIARAYRRESTVIYPPVDVDHFSIGESPRKHYLAGGRMVHYKRLDRAIEAANRAALPLVVFGDGPEMGRLARLAGPTVDFVGLVSSVQLADLIRHSHAFLFPGVEDFGILPVEAQSGGCPVIALAKGGAVETVLHGETGLLYEDDSVQGLLDAISQFERNTFDPKACLENALRFNRARFEREIVENILGIYGDM
jgi:glycosyltransferase involved in cell wall biosynthesis